MPSVSGSPSKKKRKADADDNHQHQPLSKKANRRNKDKNKSKYKNAPGNAAPGPSPPQAAAASTSRNAVDPAISAARAAMPVAAGRQAIVSALQQHDSIIVLGETGSGKTTQIPQFLFDAGFADGGVSNQRPQMIGVTQPRRVAATSLASRVAAEMGCPDPAKLPMRSQAMATGKNAKNKKAGKAPALVGYSIRFDDRSGPETRIKFMTDGWILREMVGPALSAHKRQANAASNGKGKNKESAQTPAEDVFEDLSALLLSYAVIIIDEAHERTLDTDLILGLAKRIQAKRKQIRHRWKTELGADPSHPYAGVTELKLVIMSATLDARAFSDFFASSPPLSAAGPSSLATSAATAPKTTPAPILYVEGRQHPVTLFHTPEPLQDWTDAALRAILQIHTSKPAPGDILVFLTGQEEIEKLASMLRTIAEWMPDWAEARVRLTGSGSRVNGDDGRSTDEGPDDSSAEDDSGSLSSAENDSSDKTTSANPIDQIISQGLKKKKPSQNGKAHHPNGNGASTTSKALPLADPSSTPTDLLIAPIYAALGSSATQAVFAPTPPNTRKVVLATNIAETSVTIPGIVYVIDCGFAKEKVYSPDSGIEVLRAVPISRGAARQRMGRAGRVQAGECYRLYTDAAFRSLEEMNTPEILKTDLSTAALQLYAARLDPFKFEWMDAPEPESLRAALLALLLLGAVSIPESDGGSGGAEVSALITPLGRRMAALPLSPVHARTLIAASERGGPTVARQARDLVALLSVDRSVFVDASGFVNQAQAQARTAGGGSSNGSKHADVEEARDEALARRMRAGLIHRSGDHATSLNVLYAFLDVLESGGSSSKNGKGHGKAQAANVRAWCQANFVHEKTVRNVLHIRAQLRQLCRQNGIACDDDEEEDLMAQGKDGKGRGGTANGNGHGKQNGSAAVNGHSRSPQDGHDSSTSSDSDSGSGDESGEGRSSSNGLYVTRSSSNRRAAWKEERYEALREALCEGRLGNIAFRQADGSYKRIGKGQTFKIHPSSALHGRGASAIFFEELVHTTQHFARTVSAIEPAWAQTAGTATPANGAGGA
ncbi:hypothetical protein V8E36_003644 [Tilletia maclaganii]